MKHYFHQWHWERQLRALTQAQIRSTRKDSALILRCQIQPPRSDSKILQLANCCQAPAPAPAREAARCAAGQRQLLNARAKPLQELAVSAGGFPELSGNSQGSGSSASSSTAEKALQSRSSSGEQMKTRTPTAEHGPPAELCASHCARCAKGWGWILQPL